MFRLRMFEASTAEKQLERNGERVTVLWGSDNRLQRVQQPTKASRLPTPRPLAGVANGRREPLTPKTTPTTQTGGPSQSTPANERKTGSEVPISSLLAQSPSHTSFRSLARSTHAHGPGERGELANICVSIDADDAKWKGRRGEAREWEAKRKRKLEARSSARKGNKKEETRNETNTGDGEGKGKGKSRRRRHETDGKQMVNEIDGRTRATHMSTRPPDDSMTWKAASTHAGSRVVALCSCLLRKGKVADCPYSTRVHADRGIASKPRRRRWGRAWDGMGGRRTTTGERGKWAAAALNEQIDADDGEGRWTRLRRGEVQVEHNDDGEGNEEVGAGRDICSCPVQPRLELTVVRVRAREGDTPASLHFSIIAASPTSGRCGKGNGYEYEYSTSRFHRELAYIALRGLSSTFPFAATTYGIQTGRCSDDDDGTQRRAQRTELTGALLQSFGVVHSQSQQPPHFALAPATNSIADPFLVVCLCAFVRVRYLSTGANDCECGSMFRPRESGPGLGKTTTTRSLPRLDPR
ncbi:hypothetical protein BDN71DRAFT_1427064 [Pleurotus eryngii]|uniref:Uncharacterized protein n=1 Tax=Pleurotus eryngii TaxID=5323 RepID=A0A9P6A873_PLEER|nr:hypothetical protein BDN71DRAFT_1427064 [Pleurotus eryngii]